MPVVAFVHAESSNPVRAVHPLTVADGTSTFAAAPVATLGTAFKRRPVPYEIFGDCAGKFRIWLALVTPSGFTSRTDSPSWSSLKFVCSSLPGTRRSLDDAKTT